MDKFSNAIPSPADAVKQSGVSMGMTEGQMAVANKDSYGMSPEELSTGFDCTSYEEAGGDLKGPVGRIATQRIDA